MEEVAEAFMSVIGRAYLVANEGILKDPQQMRALIGEGVMKGAWVLFRLSTQTSVIDRQNLLSIMQQCPVPVVWCALENAKGLDSVERVSHAVCSALSLRSDDPLSAWEQSLPLDFNGEFDANLDTFATRYHLEPGVTQAIIQSARWQCHDKPLDDEGIEHSAALRLSEASRQMAEERTQTRPPAPDALILPEKSRDDFAECLAACRNRDRARTNWAGYLPENRNGIVALFWGPPGTGKTFSAEIIAGLLGAPLKVVNVSDIVSKYIGETEKRIRELFLSLRGQRSVLLFDEADGLFGERVQVERASDRYANIATGVLLQEIEQHRGVALLTSNSIKRIDDAFMRRIHYVVHFPEPEEAERTRLWQMYLPQGPKLAHDVDYEVLGARFPLTGARIRNVVTRSVYAACASEQNSQLTMQLLQHYAQLECRAAGLLVSSTPRRSLM